MDKRTRLAETSRYMTGSRVKAVLESRFFRRTLPIALIGGTLAYAVLRLGIYLTTTSEVWGLDYTYVMGQASRILAGGPVYKQWELTSPVLPGQMADLYPPPMVYGLFVPLSVLPALLWWIVPLGVMAAVVWHYRPSIWGWVGILAAFAMWPHTWTAIQLGNPAMWIASLVALGTLWRWPAAFVLLKPTLLPFALIGVRSRWWWVACLVLVAVSVAMIPAWIEYVRVLRNLTGFEWTYSLHDVGFVLIPCVAWATSGTRSRMTLNGGRFPSRRQSRSSHPAPVAPAIGLGTR